VFKGFGAATLALLLVACGAPKSRQAPAHGTVSPATPQSTAGRVYRIDPAQSELRVLVYRAGPMAALGHNHVIVNRALGGWVTYAGEASAASFTLVAPAAGFAVDEAAARREEGADFAQDIPDDAKSGTLRNMLSPALLDAANFPEITVRSEQITGGGAALAATVTVNVAGRESRLTVPFTVDISADRLRAAGEFELRQTAVGLTPLSVLLGALRVEDQMRVKFKFVAAAT